VVLDFQVVMAILAVFQRFSTISIASVSQTIYNEIIPNPNSNTTVTMLLEEF